MSLPSWVKMQNGQRLPSAKQRSAIVDHLLAQQWRGAVLAVPSPQAFRHPWRVKAARFTPGPTSTLPERTWALSVRPGTILDQMPSILYRREKDPRGWIMPEGYVETPKGEGEFIERDPLDDLDDPPILVLRETADFTQITDKQRPSIESGAFCGAVDWERELWRAHVILSARPLATPWLFQSPPTLRRFRLYATRALPPATVAAAGASFELATVYLLRDPQNLDGSIVKIRQREWWPLWTALVQPLADLPGQIANLGETGDPLTDLIAQLTAGEIADTLSQAATVEAWTV